MAIDWLAAAAWTAVIASGTTANVQHNRAKQAARRQKEQNNKIAKTATIDRINSSGRQQIANRGIRKRVNLLNNPLLPSLTY